MSKTPSELLREGAETYEKKNEDYGDSWRLVGKLLYLMAGEEDVTLSSEEDWIEVGLLVRRLDKFTREFNGFFLAEDMNFEDLADSPGDNKVYASMAESLIKDMEE